MVGGSNPSRRAIPLRRAIGGALRYCPAAGLVLGCLLAFPADAAGKRVALVIGISDYHLCLAGDLANFAAEAVGADIALFHYASVTPATASKWTTRTS
ncbi:hypothetical protein [Luteimonas sp. A501]